MSEAVFVRAENLTKQYQLSKQVTVPVLHGLTFQIMPGEVVALVGPSGCGKSTLLNLLGAMDHQTSGTLIVAGQDLGQMKDTARADYRAKTVGMIFQSFNLLPHLTARQNVLLPAVLAGRATKATAARVDELLDRVGLRPRAEHRPIEMSGGEQQRLAIVRALVNQPTFVLADEPTGNLDQHTGQEILELLFDLAKTQGLTMLMVTHDPAIAARAHRQLRMLDGRLQL